MGAIGPEARRYVDWLARAGASFWQVLPLSPPGGPLLDNPYASWASLAGDPQLLSLSDLVADGLLGFDDLAPAGFREGWADHDEALPWRTERLGRAAARLLAGHPLRAELEAFRAAEADWVEHAALFAALKAHHRGAPWWEWPAPLRDREPDAVAAARRELAEPIDRQVALQFLFARQWTALRAYAAERGVRIMGDLPIYVITDSADIWGYREGWQIRPDGSLSAQSGVPPDDFADDGQLWGGALYDWERMAADGLRWWLSRLRRALALADVVRIDHFRAFAAYWEIPMGARSAREGRWVDAPGAELFARAKAELGDPLPLCVEDLGTIDAPVIALRDALGFPGMRVLHYGFGGGAENVHLPHNIPEHAIVYPGNHDNDTTRGWWASLPPHARTHVQHYLGRHGDDIAWDLIREALACPARTAVVAMQDVLDLGSEARTNDPRSYAGPVETWQNWRWRLLPQQADDWLAERLRFLASLYGRVPGA